MKPSISLSIIVLLLLAIAGQSQAPKTPPADAQLPKAAGITLDGPGLLGVFRKRSPGEPELQRIGTLIKQLDNDAFRLREDASKQLVEFGPAALSQLREAVKGNSVEAARRAEKCIEDIERAEGELVPAALRQLKESKPDGASAVLLAYLPFAPDENAEEEVLDVLLAVGVRDGKLDPALAADLGSKTPSRRAAAALVASKSGIDDQKKTVRELLADKEPVVRLRAAQGLLAGQDKSAVPTLIALLTDGPLNLAAQAEEVLTRASADKGPTVSLGETEATRKKSREAWEAWWKDNESKVDLKRSDLDAPLCNWNRSGKDLTLCFLNAYIKGDNACKKLIGAPFFDGRRTMKTQEEVDRYMDDCLLRLVHGHGQLKITYNIKDVSSLQKYAAGVGEFAEFVKTLSPDVNVAEFAEFVKTLPANQVRVVYYDYEQGGNSVIFVRLDHGRMRIVGWTFPPSM